MSDYLAIYDAVRSRINGDVASVARDVMWQLFDVSHQKALLQEQISIVGYEMTRPSVLFRPSIYVDGNQWCALYGSNLQDGVAGFGDTPGLAMEAFDKAWNARLPAVTGADRRDINSVAGAETPTASPLMAIQNEMGIRNPGGGHVTAPHDPTLSAKAGRDEPAPVPATAVHHAEQSGETK